MSVYNIKNVLFWGLCVNHFKSIDFKKPSAIVHMVLGILEAIPVVGQVFSFFEYSVVKLFHLDQTDQKVQRVVETLQGGRIDYVKGEVRTRDLGISTKREKKYGKGACGEVKGVVGRPNQVLKKGVADFRQEFGIGQKIGGHPCFIEMEQLYVKTYHDQNKSPKYKLLMEKVDGKNLAVYCYRQVFSLDEVVAYLEMLKSSCIHLYERGVVWVDLNTDNIMVLDDRSGLKVVDYGGWYEVENPEERAQKLFLGALEIIGWVIKSSFLGSVEKEFSAEEYGVQYPESFFFREVTFTPVFTLAAPLYQNFDWMTNFSERVEGKTDEEIMEVLANYFDSVIAELQKHAE